MIIYKKTENDNFPYVIGDDKTQEVIGFVKTKEQAELIVEALKIDAINNSNSVFEKL